MTVAVQANEVDRPIQQGALWGGQKLFHAVRMGSAPSRRMLRPAPQSGMPRWQDRLFIGLARSANDATDYFQIPTERVVEVGTQVTI